jgi:hypothetical protein
MTPSSHSRRLGDLGKMMLWLEGLIIGEQDITKMAEAWETALFLSEGG